MASNHARRRLVSPMFTQSETAPMVQKLVLLATAPIPMPMIGHVTSSYYSATLDRSIALAVLVDGRARKGEVVHIPMPEGTLRATVTDTVFFDPEGSRLNG